MKVGKTVRKNDRVLMVYSVHPTSKYTDVKSVQRPLLDQEERQIVGWFRIHVTPNATNCTHKVEASTPKSNHGSRPPCLCGLGTELWNQHLSFTSQIELSECPPLGNQHTAQSFLELTVLSSEANLALKNKTPKG